MIHTLHLISKLLFQDGGAGGAKSLSDSRVPGLIPAARYHRYSKSFESNRFVVSKGLWRKKWIKALFCEIGVFLNYWYALSVWGSAPGISIPPPAVYFSFTDAANTFWVQQGCDLNFKIFVIQRIGAVRITFVGIKFDMYLDITAPLMCSRLKNMITACLFSWNKSCSC